MAISSSGLACQLVPEAAVLYRPSKNGEMATSSSRTPRILIPGTPILSPLLGIKEMAIVCSRTASMHQTAQSSKEEDRALFFECSQLSQIVFTVQVQHVTKVVHTTVAQYNKLHILNEFYMFQNGVTYIVCN